MEIFGDRFAESAVFGGRYQSQKFDGLAKLRNFLLCRAERAILAQFPALKILHHIPSRRTIDMFFIQCKN